MKKLAWINFFAFIATVTVNALANILPINGQNTGEISDKYPVLFTPAGYVFSIWGLIYLLLAGYVVYQLLPSQKNNPHLKKIKYLFLISSFFNSIWIFLWHYNLLWLSLFAMLGLLTSLLLIFINVVNDRQTPKTLSDHLLIDIPFSIYLGWISVATIANASVVLYNSGWNGEPFGQAFWTILVVLIAFGLGLIMQYKNRNVFYGLVIAWAVFGISIKNAGNPLLHNFTLIGTVLYLILIGLFYIIPKHKLTS